jgi:hypothetical protein
LHLRECVIVQCDGSRYHGERRKKAIGKSADRAADVKIQPHKLFENDSKKAVR